MIDDFDDALALANGPLPPSGSHDGARARPVPPVPPGADPAGEDRAGPGTGPAAHPTTATANAAADADCALVSPAWDSARATAHRCVRPLPPRRLPIDLALGHTLAAPLAALTDLPAFDTSAMDGWAVAGPGPWRVTDATGALAGAPAVRPLTDGEAVPIATGARVPDGTTAVLRSEHGTVEEGRLRGTNPQPGADIRPRGQECRTGTELLPARTPLTPRRSAWPPPPATTSSRSAPGRAWRC